MFPVVDQYRACWTTCQCVHCRQLQVAHQNAAHRQGPEERSHDRRCACSARWCRELATGSLLAISLHEDGPSARLHRMARRFQLSSPCKRRLGHGESPPPILGWAVAFTTQAYAAFVHATLCVGGSLARSRVLNKCMLPYLPSFLLFTPGFWLSARFRCFRLPSERARKKTRRVPVNKAARKKLLYMHLDPGPYVTTVTEQQPPASVVTHSDRTTETEETVPMKRAGRCLLQQMDARIAWVLNLSTTLLLPGFVAQYAYIFPASSDKCSPLVSQWL